MVYKRYAKKNGKIYGPYYYKSYRENGVVKKVYIGQKNTEVSKADEESVVPRTNISYLTIFVVALVALIILAGFLIVKPTGKISLQIEPDYHLNEVLEGQISVNIEQGDSIQKDSEIKLTLSKNNDVLAETTKTFEEFLGNQISYIAITNDSISCENITIPITQEVCHDEEIIDENNETIIQQVCVNETIESGEENCTTTQTTDYYYQTPGGYSRNIEELISYDLDEEGDYVLELEIPSLGISSQEEFSVSAPAEAPEENITPPLIPPAENVSNLTKKEPLFGIMAAPNAPVVILNSSSGYNLTGDNLTCWANATDTDGDNLTYAGEWYRNGSIFIQSYWSKTHDGGLTDTAYGIAVDSSGNVYVTGASSLKYYTIKYNSSGGYVWNRSVSTAYTDVGRAVAFDSSGNVYVTGYYGHNISDSDYYTIKYNSSGSALWNKSYDSGDNDYAYGIAVDSSGNVYVTGYLQNALGGFDFNTIKYDTNGNYLWGKTYDGGNSDRAYGIAVDSSGNVYVTGGSFGANDNYYTIKYDSSGNHIWNKTYNGGGTETAYGIAVDESQNVYVTGVSGLDYYTIKYNSSGSHVWNKTYDGGNNDYAYGIAVDAFRNVYVTGQSGIDAVTYRYYTIKYQPNGTQIWSKIYYGGNSDNARAIAVDSSENIYVTGYSSNGVDADYYTIKYKDGFVKFNQTQGQIVPAGLLEDSFTVTGENWSCSARAFDGQDYSDAVMSGILTILENVTTCGLTITQNTTLTGNLQCNGTALTIGANDVVLDCAGYRIIGNGSGYGVNISTKNNITIKNCYLEKYNQSIRIVTSSSEYYLENNTFVKNVYGVFTDSTCHGGNITANNFTLNQISMSLPGNFTEVSNNIMWNQTSYDIRLYGSNGTISNNNIYTKSGSYSDAVYIQDGDGNLVSFNNITLDSDGGNRRGLYIGGNYANDNIFSNNIVKGTSGNYYPGYGVYITANIEYRNQIVNNSFVYTSTGVYTNGENTTIEGNLIDKTVSGSAIYIFSNAHNSKIIRNTINDSNATANHNVIEIRDGLQNIEIKDNVIYVNTTATASDAIFITGYNTLDFKVINNTIYGAPRTGILVYLGCMNGTVANNTLVNCGYSDTATYGAISLLDSFYYNTVTGNNISKGGVGIYLRGGINYPSRNDIINNNTITDTTSHGIIVYDANSLHDYIHTNVISNNTIRNCGAYGIYYAHASKNTVISNTIDNCTLGGIILGGLNINATFHNNTISNCPAGFTEASDGNYYYTGSVLMNSTGNNITYNRIYNSSVYGIRIVSTLSKSNLFVGNYIENATTGMNISAASPSHSIINTTIKNAGIGLWMIQPAGLVFTNITYYNVNQPLIAYNSLNFSIEKTQMPVNMRLINTSNAEINFTQAIDLTTLLNFWIYVGLRRNYAFVNSTAKPELNKSSIMRLTASRAVGNPRILVDLEDDGSYETCNATTKPACINLSVEGYDYIFNATHFTAYQIEALDYPQIEFKAPTPNNGASIYNTSIEINVSVIENAMTDFRFNWNGTNYTLYNDSLVLMYNFENLSSLGENATKVVDVSKYSNNGTVYNGANWISAGKYGGAYSFDGVDDYIENNTQIVSAYPFTLAAWVKFQTGAGDIISLVDKDADNIQYSILTNGTNAEIWARSGSPVYSIGSTTINNNQWHHVVGVFVNNTYRALYVDGQFEAFNATSVVFNSAVDRFSIGRFGDSTPTNYFNGSIDEARIWNRSLTASEISQMYKSNLQKYSPTQWYFYSNQSNLSIGNYTYSAWARNNINNENSTEVRTLSITQVPGINVTLVSPKNGYASVGERNVSFTCNATSESGLNSIILYVWNLTNGNLIRNLTNSVSGTSNESAFNHTFALEGMYKWSCRANATGISGFANENRTLYVANDTAPTVVIQIPENNSVQINESVAFVFIASSRSSGNLSCYLLVDNLIKKNFTIPQGQNLVSDLFAEGRYAARIGCFDRNNSFGISDEVLFNVSFAPDTAAPNVNLIGPTNSSEFLRRDIYLFYNSTDNSGIQNCTLWTDISGSWQAYSGHQNIFELNGDTKAVRIGNLSLGNYTWNVNCTDSSGNSAFAAENYTFKILGTRACYCDSCSNCSDALNNLDCTIVLLTKNISANGTCIETLGKRCGQLRKTFDGQGHTISGQNSRTGILIGDYSGSVLGTTNIYFVLDMSSTMNEENKLSDLKTATKNFVTTIFNDTTVENQVGIVTFASGAALIQNLTTNETLLDEKIDGLTAYGMTAMGTGIHVALDSLLEVNGTKYIVVVSDGLENLGVGSIGEANTAAVRGVTINTLGLGMTANETNMPLVANITGGKYYFAPTSSQIQSIYNTMAVDPTYYCGGVENYTLKNVTVVNFETGVSFSSGRKVNVSDVSAQNATRGMLFEKTEINLFDDNSVYNFTTFSALFNNSRFNLTSRNSEINFTGNFDLKNTTLTGGIQNFSLIMDISGNMSLDNLSKIDITGLGYPGGLVNGSGPGRSNSGYGASHGGRGWGDYSYGYRAGAIYGSSLAPATLGSGGSGTGVAGGEGGNGGSAVQIHITDNLIMNGDIVTNGTNGGSSGQDHAGGGTGGSIYITTNAFAGSGHYIAIGGNGPHSPPEGLGGGGGRIAVYYNTTNLNYQDFINQFSVAGGNAGYAGSGKSGTLILVDVDDNQAFITDGFRFQEACNNSWEHNQTPCEYINTSFFNLENPSIWNFTSLTITDADDVITNTTLLELRASSMVNITDTNWYSSSETNDTYRYYPGVVLVANNSLKITTPTLLPIIGSDISQKNITLDLDSNFVLQNTTISTDSQNAFIFAEPALNMTIANSSEIRANINITVDTLTLSQNSKLNAVAKGYPRGNATTNGSGPGGGSSSGGGGGHGGRGGPGISSSLAGKVYGSSLHPTIWGSGGGGLNSGAGGGAIILNTNIANLEGNVLSSSQDEYYVSAGGGAGGSIYITTNTLTGSGNLTASGGRGLTTCSSTAYGGGGGRIAVYYNESTYTGKTSVSGGVMVGVCGGPPYSYYLSGMNGTTIIVDVDDNSALIVEGFRFQDICANGWEHNQTACEYMNTTFFNTANPSVWNFTNLTIRGADNVITNISLINLVVADTFSLTNTFWFTSSEINTTFANNNLNITANNLLPITGGNINQKNINIDSGSNIEFRNTIIKTGNMSSGLVISEPLLNVTVNNSKIFGNLNINADAFLLSSSSLINASEKGYLGGLMTNGSGPGGGKMSASGTYSAGAGHGGDGGESATAGFGLKGNAYGSSFYPTTWGSGGASSTLSSNEQYRGGSGGGAVVIAANLIDLRGNIEANGGDKSGYPGSSGGSGGSILLQAGNLTGNGVLSAKGGRGFSHSSYSQQGYGAGGGRIAIYYNDSTFNSTANITGGMQVYYSGGYYYYPSGKDGSLIYLDVDDKTAYITGGFKFQEACNNSWESNQTACEYQNTSFFNTATGVITFTNMTINASKVVVNATTTVLNITNTLNIINSDWSKTDGAERLVFIYNTFSDFNSVYPDLLSLSLDNPNVGRIDWLPLSSGLSNISGKFNISNNRVFVNSTAVGKIYNIIDEFNTSEAWSENQMTGTVIGGSYRGTITNIADPYMSNTNIAWFNETYNNLEIRYLSNLTGVVNISLWYIDKLAASWPGDCSAFSATCSQSFPIISDGAWHLLDVEITDDEWIDDDGVISQLRFHFEGVNATGKAIYLDYIKFYKSGFNASANITLYGISAAQPTIYADFNDDDIFERCSSDICTMLSPGATTIFNVTHFTTYIVSENISLTIDNNGPKFVNQTVTFNATYVNLSSGQLISGATCNITFNDSSVIMSELADRYEYNRSFASNGTYYYNVSCGKAGLPSLLASDNVTIVPDVTAPNVTIISPENATFTNESAVNFTINASDESGLANATLYIYNQTGLYNQTTINLGGVLQTTISVVVWLADGVYNWFWEVLDIAGNLLSTQTTPGNYTITADTTVPLIEFVPPTEIFSSILNRTNVNVNVSVNDTNFANVTINLYNSTDLINSTISTGNVFYLNFTNLVDGIYYFNATTYDLAGNFNSSEMRNVTIDTIAPNITIITPVQFDIVGWDVLLIANATDIHLDAVRYEIYNGTLTGNVIASGVMNNIGGDIFNGTLYTNETWPYDINILNSTNLTFIVYANDSVNNVANASSYFVLDNTKPSIQHVTPTQNGNYFNSDFNLNIYLSNHKLNYTLYNITNSSGIQVQFNSTQLAQSSFTWNDLVNVSELAEGNYTLYTYARDSSSPQNDNNKTTWFYIDKINPAIEFVTPTETSGSYLNRTNILANVTDGDVNFANFTIYLYNSTTLINESFSISDPYFVNFVNLADGLYYFNATAYDLAGNFNSSETRNVTIDTILPLIEFVPPTENSGLVYHRTNIRVNVSVNDTNPANITIYLYNSTSLVNSSTRVGNTFYLNFTNLVDGRYYFNATAYDLAGNFNSSQTRNLTIDTIAPNITIINPPNETITNETLQNFTINVSDEIGLENATLYIYNETGLYNETTVNIGGTTDFLTIIVNLIAGIYNWFWEVVDLAGNIASTQLTEGNYTTTVDLTNPEVYIISPSNITYNYSSILVNLTAIDDYLDSIWFFNGTGVEPYPGEVYRSYDDGIYTIIAYANDSAGNSNSTNVTFEVDTTNPNITIITPIDNEVVGWQVTLLANVTDVNLESIWYEIYNGTLTDDVIASGFMDNTYLGGDVYNATLFTNETWPYNASELNSTNLTFVVYANDSLGHVSNLSSYFVLDNTKPAIQFIMPQPAGSIVNNPFNLHIQLSNQQLNYSSYNITNSSGFIVQFNETNLSIPFFEWLDFVNITQLGEGNYSVNVYARDFAQNNNTKSAWFYVDLTPPNVTIISPENATFTNESAVNFTINASDESGLANATLYIYNQTGLYNQTTINLGGVLQTTISVVVWLADGVYNWFWEVLDIAGNLLSTQTTPGNYTITADTIVPLIEFVPPTEISSSIYNRTDINVNVSVNDTNFANVTIYLYNKTGLVNSTISTGNVFYLNFTNLADGIYYFNATTYDLAGNFNSSEMRNVTIDTIAPNITIITPVQFDIVGWSVLLIANATDIHLDAVRYEIYNGTLTGNVIASGVMNNIGGDVFNGTLYTNETWPYDVNVLNSTNLTFIVYANDSVNNVANASSYFVLDNTKPSIQHITPTQNGNYFNNDFNLNIYLSNHKLNYTLYNITNSSGIQVQFNSTQLVQSSFTWNDFVNITGLAEGNYTLYTYARDSSSPQNDNNKTTWFYVDKTNPAIEFVTPTEISGSYLNRTNIFVNVTDGDINFANFTISLYNSTDLINESSSTSDPYFVNFVNLADGIYYFNATAYDLAGNGNSSETRNVTIDTILPLIEFVPLTENSGLVYHRTNIRVNVSVNDTNPANITIYLYNSTDLINSSISAGNIFYLNFTNLVDGIYYFNAITYDLAGNFNSTEMRNVTIDTISPNVTIISPENATFTNESAVNFTINASDNTGLRNATLYIYNQTGLYNQTTINLGGVLQTTISVVVWLADGVYNWFWEVFDIAGNLLSTQTTPGNYTITADMIVPLIDFVPPTEISGSIYNRTNVDVNVSVNDTNFANVTINLYNSTDLINSTTSTGNVFYLNFTNLADGLYYFNAITYDLAGNFNSSETRNVTIDTIAPEYSNNATEPASPVTYVPGANYTFNITWSDLNGISSAILNFNGTDYTMNFNGINEYNYTLSDIGVGNYSYYFWANDSIGNSNQTVLDYYLIEKASPNLLLNITPSNSVTSGTETNASGTGCPNQLNCMLYRDDVNVSNPDVAILAAGTYLYDFNTAGNENYTSASINETLIVAAGGVPGEGGGCSSTKWNCSDWGNCTNNEQARECISNCGTYRNETKACVCVPNWSCTDLCTDEYMLTTCRDLKNCGTDEGRPKDKKTYWELPYQEEPYEALKCKKEYRFTNWSECIYDNDANKIILGVVTRSGTKSREWFDLDGCRRNRTEYSHCTSDVLVELEEREVCKKGVITIVTAIGRIPITTIDLEAWNANRLDVSFIQGKVTYCASCYNGILDGSEVGIDCGGECRACKPETEFPLYLIIGLLVIIALLLVIPILKYAFEDYEAIYEINSLVKSGEKSLKDGDRKRAVDNFRKMKMLYIRMENAANKKVILKEIQKYQRKIKGFTEF